MDQIPYYLKRKNYLDTIRRTKDSSELKSRALEVLSKDHIDSINETYRQDFIEPKQFEDNSTVEERFLNYINEIEQREDITDGRNK